MFNSVSSKEWPLIHQVYNCNFLYFCLLRGRSDRIHFSGGKKWGAPHFLYFGLWWTQKKSSVMCFLKTLLDNNPCLVKSNNSRYPKTSSIDVSMSFKCTFLQFLISSGQWEHCSNNGRCTDQQKCEAPMVYYSCAKLYAENFRKRCCNITTALCKERFRNTITQKQIMLFGPPDYM